MEEIKTSRHNDISTIRVTRRAPEEESRLLKNKAQRQVSSNFEKAISSFKETK